MDERLVLFTVDEFDAMLEKALRLEVYDDRLRIIMPRTVMYKHKSLGGIIIMVGSKDFHLAQSWDPMGGKDANSMSKGADKGHACRVYFNK